MASKHETESQTGVDTDEILWVSDALVDRTDERNQAAVRVIYHKYWELIRDAPGSSHNHQAWQGGYLEHIRQVNHFVDRIYSLWVDLGVFASLPEEERFTLGEALTVTSLHDIEKPFRTILGPDGKPIIDPNLATKQQRDAFKWAFFEEHGIDLNPNQQNAMKYVEGFYPDYLPTRRIICPMGVIAHAADLMSGRGSYNLNNPGTVRPEL